MQRIRLTSDLNVSQLVYGMWRLGDDTDKTPEHIRNKIAACLDQGITTMDQADIYGGYEAEELLGAALTPELRAQIEIVTKCDIVAPVGRYADAPLKYYDTSRAHLEASVDHSLRLMGIDHIDVLLIHRPDPMMDAEETGAALDDLVASGKIRSIGVSNFRPWDWSLLQSAMKNPLVTNQIELSAGSIAPFNNGDVSFHQQHKTPMMAWSPLGGGALMAADSAVGQVADKLADQNSVDRAAVLIAFLLAHPATILPVLGTNSLERIAAISTALNVKLSREDWFAIYTASLGHEVP